MTYHAPMLPVADATACSAAIEHRPHASRPYAPREVVQHQGGAPLAMSEIVWGSALVMRDTEKWGRTVLDVLGRGALIGGAVADCSIVAATELQLRPVDGDKEAQVSRLLCQELARQRQRRMVLAQATAMERIAHLLLQLAAPPSQCHAPWRDDALAGRPISIPLTRREMASLLALTVETLSRCFARLRQQGILEMVSPTLVTVSDAAALLALGGDGGAPCPADAAMAAMT